jgi:F-type H+-transporting ATPase subunit c
MKLLKIAALAVGLFLVAQAPASAQQSVDDQARIAYASSTKAPFSDPRALSTGLIVIGAAVGIGWLGRSTVEAMARQPGVAGQAQTAMIIAAAEIVGVTLFALLIIMIFMKPY